MTAQPGYPEPDEMLGPYRIVRRLGVGGMGVVFEAVDTTLDRRVALKVISTHLADDESFRARFTHEARAQASLDSPHVVAVYAHGDADGRLYIATQLVPDGDLGALIAAYGAPPVRTALDIIAQVASGLADAHASGLVHRDIKPPNVLLRRRGNALSAYLADFGIARQVDSDHSLTSVGQTIGTPTFMAPELHTGAPSGVASDVYSLGCLLWATLSGHAPYGGTSDYQIVTAHFEQPIPQLVPAEDPLVGHVNRVLRIALAKQPADRYTSAFAMRDDLYAALRIPDEGAAAATRSSGPPVRSSATPVLPAPAPRRGRVALVLALVAVVLLAAARGGYVLLTQDDDEPSSDPGGEASSATSSSPDPTDSEPSDPSDTGSPEGPPPPSGPFSDEDRAKAEASLTEAVLVLELGTDEQSACIAEGWIDNVGLEQMVEEGFFDEDFNFVDQPEMSTETREGITAAVITCVPPGLP
ncbi:MAG: serine/threonine-protein kinase [Nocardioides sp.]